MLHPTPIIFTNILFSTLYRAYTQGFNSLKQKAPPYGERFETYRIIPFPLLFHGSQRITEENKRKTPINKGNRTQKNNRKRSRKR